MFPPAVPLAVASALLLGQTPADVPRHAVVFHRPDTFAAWPANGGLWVYDGGQEAAVGLITGRHEAGRAGHDVVPPYTNRLARTTDGGRTWVVDQPPGFFQTGDRPRPLAAPLDLAHPDLALRFAAEGYQGGHPKGAVMVASFDRGRTWKGPFEVPALLPAEQAGGLTEITLRTETLPISGRERLVLASARRPGKGGTDRAFCCKLTDGGRGAAFLGWLAGPDTPHRVLMPAAAAGPDGALVGAVRVRRTPADDNWIDGYRSTDGGRRWTLVGRIGHTGAGNGNPPALIRLRDGRLCCGYGDRTRCKVFARLSRDDGRTWGAEAVLRDGYQPDPRGEVDFGYVRLFERPDRAVVAVYYWADRDRPTPHIAATTWTPPA